MLSAMRWTTAVAAAPAATATAAVTTTTTATLLAATTATRHLASSSSSAAATSASDPKYDEANKKRESVSGAHLSAAERKAAAELNEKMRAHLPRKQLRGRNQEVAGTLFALAGVDNSRAAVANDVAALKRRLEDDTEFRRWTKAPVSVAQRATDLKAKFFKDVKVSAATQRFFNSLSARNQWAELKPILDHYTAIVASENADVDISVTLAAPWHPHSLSLLMRALTVSMEAKFLPGWNPGPKYVPSFSFDPKILGGFILSVKTGQSTFLCDYSLASKLKVETDARRAFAAQESGALLSDNSVENLVQQGRI